MADSKYAGLKELKNPKGKGPDSAPKGVPAAAVLTPKERKLTGKRSDPDFKQQAVLLKIASVEEARQTLKRKYNGRDFSELLQALLDQWNESERTS
jgi:hypothetical protein